MARVPAKKAGARKATASKATARKTTARKTTARKTTARKTTARKITALKAAPARKSTARRSPVRRAASNPTPAAPPRAAAVGAVPAAGTADLAGGLRSLLGSVETEVRAVSALSERIDELVGQLNEVREEQAKRLIVLDALRGAVDDTNLGTFLDKAIRPRRARVAEVVPDRLNQG